MVAMTGMEREMDLAALTARVASVRSVMVSTVTASTPAPIAISNWRRNVSNNASGSTSPYGLSIFPVGPQETDTMA